MGNLTSSVREPIAVISQVDLGQTGQQFPRSRFYPPAKHPFIAMSSSSNSNSAGSGSARVPSRHHNPQDAQEDNRVTREDVEHFTFMNTSIPYNSARRFIVNNIPAEQISRLDTRTHSVSRVGWGAGTYPSNYEVVIWV